MLDIYMYISFFLMGIIFLRQIAIYKQPNKINYAPLILGIGAIASVLHFIIADESHSLLFVIKGSFIPFLVALMLFVIMNIMHQTQHAEEKKMQQESTQLLLGRLGELEEALDSLEHNMQEYALQEERTREAFSKKLNEDLEKLSELLHNQHRFMDRFSELEKWHTQLQELFINFTEFKLPELERVVHSHIEMLQISNKEHFERIQSYLEAVLGTRETIAKELQAVVHETESIRQASQKISNEIIQTVQKALHQSVQNTQQELQMLKSHLEALQTSLRESEQSLIRIKEHTHEAMDEIDETLQTLHAEKAVQQEMTKGLHTLEKELQDVALEYARVTKELALEVENLLVSRKQLQEESKEFVERLAKRLDEVLQKQEKSSSSDNLDVQESLQLLAKQIQMQHSDYTHKNPPADL